MYDAYSCGFDGVIIRPKRAHKQEITHFYDVFACHRSHGGAKKSLQLSEPDAFGITLGSVWVSVGDFGSLDGHFTVIVESLWVYESPFQKTFIFPTIG